jgi:hypothetical protein
VADRKAAHPLPLRRLVQAWDLLPVKHSVRLKRLLVRPPAGKKEMRATFRQDSSEASLKTADLS